MQHSQGKKAEPPRENSPAKWELLNCCQQAGQLRALQDFTLKKTWGSWRKWILPNGKIHPRELGVLGGPSVEPVVSALGAAPT